MTKEIIANIKKIEFEMGENQKKLDNLKKKIDESNKKKAELERKKNDIEKIIVPYKKQLEEVIKAKENIENQARKKRAIINLEINDEKKREILDNNINRAKQEVDEKIRELEKEENNIRDKQTILEDEIKAINDKITYFESLKNYPKTLKIEEDIKKFNELKGKIEKEQILSRSSYLLDFELKSFLEEARIYKTVNEFETELIEAFDAADKAKIDLIDKNKQLKNIQSELAVKLQETKTLKNNREAEILKLL